MRRKKVLRWGLIEIMVLGWALSCGRTEETADDLKRGDDGSEAVGDAGVGADGNTSSGGRLFQSGGASSSGGGTDITIQPPVSNENNAAHIENCEDLPKELLDPPCSDDDLIVESECNFNSSRTFNFPVDSLRPPTEALQLVLLHANESRGLGGQGGQTGASAPLPVQVWLLPPSGGNVSGDFFEITEAETVIYAQLFFERPEFAPYLQFLEDPNYPSSSPSMVAQVALISETEVLAELRVIFEPDLACIRISR